MSLNSDELKVIIEHSPTLIWKSNADKSLDYFSNSWLKFRGRSLEEERLDGWQEGVHPDDLQNCLDVYYANFDKKLPFEVEYRLKRHDGVYRWIVDKAKPHFDKSDDFTGYIGYCVDISQQKVIEQQIAHQNAIQKLLIGLASNFINVQLEEVSNSIEAALKDLGHFFQVDRVYVFDYNWDNETTNNTYEWCAYGIAAEIDNLQGIPLEALPQWVEKHQKGEILKIFDTEAPHIPEEIKEILLPQGIQSIMTIPLMLEELCIGFVGFDSVRKKRNYTQEEEEMLMVFANMLVNISNRQLAQQQIIDSRTAAEQREKELREAQKVASLASWYLDLENGQVTWSEELYQMYGFDPSLPPPSYEEQEKIFTPESWILLNQSVAKTIEKGIPYELELNFVKPDEKTGWMWAKGEAVFDKKQKIIGLRGIAQDTTRRKEMEIALQNSKEKQEAIARRLQVASTSAGLGIFEWNIIDNHLIWDDRMYELYNYDKKHTALNFESWSNRIHPDDLDSALEDINQALTGKKEFNTSFRIIYPNGQEFFIKSYAHVVRDVNGVATKMIGVNMDITASQLHQRSLETKNKQLIEFSNIVAHNLRAPLVNVELLTDLIQETEDPNETRELNRQLKIVLQDLNDIFHELMEAIQIRRNLNIQHNEINCEEVINQVLKEFETQISAAKATVSIDVSSAPLMSYPIEYLNSILRNLISNAIKYQSPNRSLDVSIKTERNHRDVILSVTDNGLGIDMKVAEKNIFKIRKVFHDHPDAKGFGLFLIKTQIDTMDGEIWVESEPDQGSTFYVKFKNATL